MTKEMNSGVTGEDMQNLLLVTQLSADKIFEYDVIRRRLDVSRITEGKIEMVKTFEGFDADYHDGDVLYSEDFEIFSRFFSVFFEGETEATETIRFFDDVLKTYIWFKVRGKAVYDAESKKMVKIIGTLKNAEDEKDAERELVNKANRDPLTSLYNKEATTALIKRYLKSDDQNELGALIIIDIDNFKGINDNLGHLYGDNVLVDVSQDVQNLFRSSDVVGRIGGDEFLVYLRGIKLRRHIGDKANEICRVFENLYSSDSEVPITCSIGVAVYPEDGSDYEELFKKADIALYSSKNKGKNRFTLFEECENDVTEEDFQRRAKLANRYEKDIHIAKTNNVFINEITDFAFDIMDKTRDVSGAIAMLLSKVGKRFNLSRVSVAEMTETPFCLKYTYQWCADGIEPRTGMVVTSTREQWESKVQQYDNNDICSLTDVDALCREIDDSGLKFYQNAGVKAFVECAVYDSGDFRGFVGFSDCRDARIWTLEEVRTLKTISKIVSSYLLKMRAFERANKLVDQLTNYDKLTGLPRLIMFNKVVGEHLKEADEDARFALVYFDFNNFKLINEKIGASRADSVLITFSAESRKLYNGFGSLCRVYSDKFILFTELSDVDDVFQDVLQFLTVFTGRERIKNPDCPISICAGIYIIDNPAECNLNFAIDNANIARKRAKISQENDCVLYTRKMKSEIVSGFEITADVEKAIKNREFVVYYQPKISLKTGEVVGAEALVRWIKKDGTMVYPNSFIPHLEKTMHIVSVDFYVYEEVCKYIRQCIAEGKPLIPISVNVSRMHLKDPEFLGKIETLIAEYSVPPECIEFELTESAFFDDQNMAISVMEDMRNRGFRVSIDDFGSGFSSLNLLKNLPVDVLKLDKEFFGNGILKKNDAIVVSSIIDMASKMNIDVICEGVETEQQIDFLKGTECDAVQGYYYARPIPLNEFEEYSRKVADENL